MSRSLTACQDIDGLECLAKAQKIVVYLMVISIYFMPAKKLIWPTIVLASTVIHNIFSPTLWL